MKYHYTHQIARAYGLIFSRACFCRLCYLTSSSLCVLPQHIVCWCTWCWTHVIPTADNHSSNSAVFQVGGLCIFCRFSFRYFIMTDFFFNFLFFQNFLIYFKIFDFFSFQSWNFISIKYGWSYIIEFIIFSNWNFRVEIK